MAVAVESAANYIDKLMETDDGEEQEISVTDDSENEEEEEELDVEEDDEEIDIEEETETYNTSQGRDQLEAETLHSQLISEASRQYAKLYQNMQKGRDTLHNTASCDKITRDNASRSAFSKPAPSHMVDKILSSNNQQSSTDNNRVNDDRGKVEVESPDIRTQQHLANYWLHMSRIYGLNGSAGGAFSPPVNPLAFTAMGAAGNAPAMPDNIQHHEMMLQRQQMLYQQLLYYKNHAAAAAANIMNVHHPGHQRILPAHGPLSPNGNFTDKLKSPRGDEGVQDLRHRIQSDKEVISQPDMNQVRSTGRKMADNFETYPRKSSHAGIRRPSTPEKKRKLSEANNNTSSRGNSMFLNLQKPHHQAFEAMVPPPPHVQASIELEKRKKLLLQHHSELMHHLIPMPRHESHLIPGLHFPFLPTGSAAAIPSSTCASSPPLLSPISPHSVTSSSGSSSSMISPSLSSPVSPLGHPFPHPMMHSIPHPHHHLPPHLSPTSPLYSGSATVLGYGGVRRPRDPNKPPPLKKYKCDICAKAFSRSNTLVTHRRIHTGEKPFKCEVCARAFRQPGNLTRHRLTHTTVKPYVCVVCKKAFNRASNLHTHMRTHTHFRPFLCPYCGKAFQQKVDLKIHMYTHGGGQ